MDPASLILLGAGVALLALAGGKKKPADVKESSGAQNVREIASKIEKIARVPGFADFAVATAWGESRWNNLASLGLPECLPSTITVQSTDQGAKQNEAEKARQLWEMNVSKKWRFVDNPWNDDVCRYGFGSGGWYGFLPATALSVRGKVYDNADPYLVFDPLHSTVMLLDFVLRKIDNSDWRSLPKDKQNWLAVRRAMAASQFMTDWKEEKERSQDVRRRFEGALKESGIPTSFMYKPIDLSYYKEIGAAKVLQSLGVK
jgi:hypothetical protein